MPSPRKYFPHGSVVFATASLERGLLLLSNPLCKVIIECCLARSLSLYPVRLCHYVVNANHIHLIFVVINPTDASSFMGHFKAEVAHRLNIIMGWSKRTVWCEGYDSPVILTPLRALIAIAYLYSNPAKDCQEESIDRFPGLSSWDMFTSGDYKTSWEFIRRPAFRFITKDSHCLEGYTREANRLLKCAQTSIDFELEPNAWLEAFGITDPEEQRSWNEILIKRVRTLEQRARDNRLKKGITVIGRAKLVRRKLTLNFQSERSGKRTWCLSDRKFVRVRFIRMLKGLIEQARAVFMAWHRGDYSTSYPPGLFPPGMPKLVEPVGVW